MTEGLVLPFQALALLALAPAAVLGTMALRAGFTDREDRVAPLAAAGVLGLAVPLVHPAIWSGTVGMAELMGHGAAALFLVCVAFGCVWQAALAELPARLLAGALMGAGLAVGAAQLDPGGGTGLGAGLLAAGAAAAGFVVAGRDTPRAGPAAAALMFIAMAAVLPFPSPGADPPAPAARQGWPGLGLGLLLAAGLGFAAWRFGRAQRDQAEARLHARLTDLAEASPEPMALLEQGALELANDAFIGLLGQAHELVPGRRLPELFPRETEAWIAAASRGRLSAGSRARLLTAQGLVEVSVTFQALPGPGATQLLICRDMRAQIESEARIRFLTEHDALTGLWNRASLIEALGRRVADGQHEENRFALLHIGMDGFRGLNDLHGHNAGDLILREVARRILSVVGPEAPLARFGGDEFAALLPVGESLARARHLSTRVLAAIARPIMLPTGPVKVSASAGIASFPRDAETPDELLAMGEIALRRAKAAGHRELAEADAERDSEERALRQLADDLRLAVSCGQLRLWLQPQADAATGAPVGFEALLRWQHPVHGMVPPDRFIPLAEAAGLIDEIGDWVLAEATRQAAGWPRPWRIAVNASPLQLRRGDYPERVAEALRASGLAAGRLEIEITESAMIDMADGATAQLRRLHEMGVAVSLDDFGTGHSSLSTLRAFHFDKLKMDRSFLRAVDQDPKAEAVIRAVLALGQALAMAVVAEGVETPEQALLLRREGCTYLQGYLLARPGPADAFAELFASGEFPGLRGILAPEAPTGPAPRPRRARRPKAQPAADPRTAADPSSLVYGARPNYATEAR